MPLRSRVRIRIKGADLFKIYRWLLAYRFTIGVNICVAQNSEQPGFNICSRFKAMEKPEGFEIGFLDEILRFTRIARQPHGSIVQRIKVLQRNGLKCLCRPGGFLLLGHDLPFRRPPGEAPQRPPGNYDDGCKRLRAASALRRTCRLVSWSKACNAGSARLSAS